MNDYIQRFLKSSSTENIIHFFSGFKNAAKEITESWAMLEAAKKYAFDLNESVVIVVGDGSTPRTGLLMAYFTKAYVVSVDPSFNMGRWNLYCERQALIGLPPERIVLHKEKIEDIEIDCMNKSCVVLWPHSHADMNNTKIFNHTSRIDIVMPCCCPIPANWAKKPHITYVDYNILSPKREMHIFGV